MSASFAPAPALFDKSLSEAPCLAQMDHMLMHYCPPLYLPTYANADCHKT